MSPTSVSVLYQGTELLSSDYEKVKAFYTFFAECFNCSVPSLLLSHCEQTNECHEDLFCTVEEVCSMLKSLDVNKSSGPDGIPAKMLKAVTDEIATIGYFTV